MVRIGKTAWFAVMNRKTSTTSRRAEKTRPRLLLGCPAPDEAGVPHGAGEPVPRVPGLSAILATAIVAVGLLHLGADRLRRGLELLGQLLGATASADQFHHLPPKLRWICCSVSRHPDPSSSIQKSVPQSGGTPEQLPRGGSGRFNASRPRGQGGFRGRSGVVQRRLLGGAVVVQRLLTDEEWPFFETFVVQAGPRQGRPPRDHRRTLDAIL